MAVPEIQSVPPGQEAQVSSGESPVPIPFDITWSTLADSLVTTWPEDLVSEALRTEAAVKPAAEAGSEPVQSLFRAVMAPARPSRPPRPGPKRDVAGREWELVLPKMPRSTRPPVRERSAAGSEERVNQPGAGAGPPLPIRIWTNLPAAAKAALLGAVLAPIAFLGWRAISSAPTAQAVVATNPFAAGEGGWMTDWATDLTGEKRGRQLTLYRPSMRMADYRMDFSGRIKRKSLGWVFRATNTNNYYGARIEIVRAGNFPTVALSRFSVIDGRETPAGQKLIPVRLRAETPYQVRFEAKGPKFTVWVQGRQVDLWEDDKLKSGGVGFFNERQELAKVLNFRLSVRR